MELKIRDFIIDSGISPHLMGYIFTYRAIEMIIEDYFRIFNLKKEVYDPLAREYHTTTSRVERDIRNAIEVAFTKNASETNYRYFKHISSDKGKPTNKEYLAIAVNVLLNGKIR